MDIKVNWLMALGASFLLCFTLGHDYKCFVCEQVKRDNNCTHKLYTCTPGLGERCFTRRYTVGGLVIRIQRGCTFLCNTKVDKWELMKAETLCCGRHLCNIHDIWPEP